MPFPHQELWLAWYDYDFFNPTSLPDTLPYVTSSNTDIANLETNKSTLEG